MKKTKKRVVILGGGPNRIGQGIEFDYCCCHAAYALKEIGYEAIIINSNPETVSTDYDTSDRLYFEPLTKEDVLGVLAKEKPLGIIVQLGGQTPLNLAVPLQEEGIRILGTSPEQIDRAEDREKFKQLIDKLNLLQPPSGTVFTLKEARRIAREIGYPVLVRPSYVLGGRAMQIVYDEHSLEEYMQKATFVSPKHPILIDKFLEDAIEVDVDVIADGATCVIGGIMEHIEEAGIHSGDSAMVLPPYSLSDSSIDQVRKAAYKLAKELKVKGLMNIQFAFRDNRLYVLEVNPRASRTVPFISKAIGMPLAKLATKVMAGMKLKDLGFTKEIIPNYISVKESVFPFNRFPDVEVTLGPEMRSTGEVMGIADDFGSAFAKSQIAAGQPLPTKGTVFISVKDRDKRQVVFIAKKLQDFGFSVVATEGTAKVLANNGITVSVVQKIGEKRPHIVDLIKSNQIQLVINTAEGRDPQKDQGSIRNAVIMQGVALITTIAGAQAAVNGIQALKKGNISVKSLQEYHRDINQ